MNILAELPLPVLLKILNFQLSIQGLNRSIQKVQKQDNEKILEQDYVQIIQVDYWLLFSV